VQTRVETMAADEKISNALKSATTHLKNSRSIIDRKADNSLLEDSVWHVAAELEYALFLFSTKVQSENDRSKWKLNPKLKKVEVGQMLVTVQDLLDDAEKFMTNEKLLGAYKSAYIARHYILEIQKDFAKKKREALKKKK